MYWRRYKRSVSMHPYWYPLNLFELPVDQRIDDARSLIFDSAPLSDPMEILGAAVGHLELSVDKPVAFLAVRLNEVTADGVSRRVTYQVLNLCHRESHEFPTPLEPGKRYRVGVPLCDIAHVFQTRQSDSCGALDYVLADDLAVSGAGESHLCTQARVRSSFPCVRRAQPMRSCVTWASRLFPTAPA